MLKDLMRYGREQDKSSVTDLLFNIHFSPSGFQVLLEK